MDGIEEIARKIAGYALFGSEPLGADDNMTYGCSLSMIEGAVLKYAPLIAQQEREECAKVADEEAEQKPFGDWSRAWQECAKDIAAAIRARCA